MEKMEFSAIDKSIESHSELYNEAGRLLEDMEDLIMSLSEETALLYSDDNDPYEVCRIKESPIEWYESEEGIRELKEGIVLLKEILAIQDDASLTQEQRAEALKPKLVTLRENYGI